MLNDLLPDAKDSGLNALIPTKKEADTQGLQGSDFVAGQYQPESMAESIHIANETGADPFLIHDNLQVIKSKQPSFDIPSLVDKYPGVTSFFQKPENAIIGKDDVEPLKQIDLGTRMVSGQSPFVSSLSASGMTGINDARKAVVSFMVSHGHLSPEEGARQMKSIQDEQNKLPQVDYLSEWDRAYKDTGNQLDKAGQKYYESASQLQDGQILESLKTFGTGLGVSTGTILDLAKGASYDLTRMFSSFSPVIASMGAGAETGAAVGSLASPAGALVGGTLGGIGSAFASGRLTFIGERFNRKLQERGVDFSNEEQLKKAFSDPALMADLRNDADSYGNTFSALNALFGGLGGAFSKPAVGLAESGIKTAARAGAGVGLQSVGQGVSELGAETAATGKPDFEAANRAMLTNLLVAGAHEAIGHSMKSRVTQTIDNPEVIPPEAQAPEGQVVDIPPEDVKVQQKLLANYSADPVQATKDVANDVKDSVQTVHDVQILSEMGDAVKESKVASRVPDKIDELVKASGGTGLVYFQTKDWDEHFQSQGLSPIKAADEVMNDGGKAYMEAKQTGGTLSIPLATYISKVAPTQHFDSLLNVVRLTPEGKNFSEANQVIQDLPQTMQALSEKAKQPAGVDEQVSQITEDTKNQLVKAGVPVEQASRVAEINAAFYKTQAANHGMDPLSLYKEQGIVFNGPAIHGLKLNQGPSSTGFYKYAKGPSALTDYANLSGSDKGRYLNQDIARELHPDWASNIKNRPALLGVTKEGSQKVLDRAFDAALKKPVLGDASFIMGGAGAGKTTAGKNALSGLGRVSDFVYDSFGANEKTMVDRINRSLESGREVYVAYVHTPFEKAVENIKARELVEGRPVSADVAAMSHVRSLESYLKLNEAFKDNPRVHFIALTPDFTGIDRAPMERGLSEIKDLRYIGPNETEAQAIERLQNYGSENGLARSSADLQSRLNGNDAGVNSSGAGGRTLFQNGNEENVVALNSNNVLNFSKALALKKRVLKAGETLPDGYEVVKTSTVLDSGFDRVKEKFAVKDSEGRLSGMSSTPKKAVEEFNRLTKKYGTNEEKAAEDSKYNEFNRIVSESGPISTKDLKTIENRIDEINKILDRPDITDSENDRLSLEITSAMSRIDSSLGRPEFEQKLIEKGLKTSDIDRALAEADVLMDKYGSADKAYKEILGKINRKIIRLFQKGEEGPRGQITIGPNQSINIELFKSKDASTPIHELGHAYLEIQKNLFEKGQGSEQSKVDYQAIRDWLGAKEGEAFTKDQHEQFARGFEAYVMEGKAPSNALRRAFHSFLKWLTNIYRSITNLKVNLSDEVKAVFDRMLASEDEIKAKTPDPLFHDPYTEGMTNEQADKYVRLQLDAQEASASELRSKLMKDLERQKSAAYKDMIDEVTKEVNQDQVYNAISILKKGVLADGSELPAGYFPMKLSKDAVREAYGDEYAVSLPPGIFDKETGLHPDVVAQILLFNSGEDLIHSIVNAPDKASLIKQLTEARLKEKYPNAFDEPQFSDEVLKAVYNEKHTEMLRMELEHLASNNLPGLKDVIRKMVKKPASDEEMKQRARELVGGKAAVSLRSNEFKRAMDKARSEAAQLLTKGDIDGAFEAKQKELLNLEAFKTAQAAENTIRKSLQKFKRAAEKDESIAKSRDLSYVYAARALLSSFELYKKTDKTPQEYLNHILQFDPDKAEDINQLLEPVLKGRKPLAELTVDDFLAVKDAFDSLWKLARDEKSVTIEGKKMAIDELSSALKAQSEKLPKASKKIAKSIDDDAKLKRDFSRLSEYATLVESLMDRWDLENPDGLFKKTFFEPVNKGAQNYRVAKTAMFEKALPIIRDLLKDVPNKEIHSPELDFTFTNKQFLLGALLHAKSNLSNFSKLLRGYGWGFVDENGVLDRSKWDAFEKRMQKEGILTSKDYDGVQAVLDLFKDTQPQVQKAHYDMRGYDMGLVKPEPYEAFGKQYEGGYYPANADPYADTDLMTRKEREELKKKEFSFSIPTTGRGFTKSRVEAYAAPLQLDPSYILPALDWVLRFVHIEPAIADARKMLANKEIRSLIKSINPNAISEVMVPWLQRAGNQRLVESTQSPLFDWILKNVRTAVVLQQLGFDIINGVQQSGGHITALAKVDAKYLAKAHFEFVKHPIDLPKWIREQSDFMKNQTGDQLYKMEQEISDILVDPNYFQKTTKAFERASFIWISLFQNHVDNVTWYGAYNQAMAEPVDGRSMSEHHDRAVRLADSAVRLTQGSSKAEHVSRLASGTRLKSIFTVFSNYWVMISNLVKTRFFTSNVNAEPGMSGFLNKSARKLFVLGIASIIPTMYGLFMRQLLQNKKLDKDHDGSAWDDLAVTYGTGLGSALVNTAAPSVGSQVYTLGQAIDSVLRDRPSAYGPSLQVSPVIASAEKGLKGAQEFARSIKKHKKMTGSEIQDVFTLLGLAAGSVGFQVPAAPLARPFSYMRDVNQGAIKQPSNAIDLVRGLMTGTGEKRKR